MNEPAIFYSSEGMEEAKKLAGEFYQDKEGKIHIWKMQGELNGLANNPEDYRRFYHNVDGKKIRHDKVHNLFGYNMTRAAGEAFDRIDPEKRFLMFSRSSYIGMHRYGGIWMGDNNSWWIPLHRSRSWWIWCGCNKRPGASPYGTWGIYSAYA